MSGDLGESEATPASTPLDFPKPYESRRCTDVICVVVFGLFVVLFVVVSLAGVADGNIAKLYRPRDFRGDYCGVADQWNDGVNGPALGDYEWLVYSMNTTDVVGELARQLICSPPVEAAYRDVGPSAQELQDYECGCCLRPCAGCTNVVDFGPIQGMTDMEDVTNTMESTMSELQGGYSDPQKLYSQLSSSAGQFARFFTDATATAGSCVSACSVAESADNASMREYVFKPDPDVLWCGAWNTIVESSAPSLADVRKIMTTNFKFDALPLRDCPYDASYCVPVPGMKFTEVAQGWCAFEAIADVGLALSEMGVHVNAGEIAGDVQVSFGKWMGDLIVALDGLVLTALCSFVVAIVFMVFLRFFLRLVVWISIFCGWAMLFGGSVGMIVRSGQCKGTSLTDSARSYADYVSAQSNAEANVISIYNGQGIVPVDLSAEAISGNGQDYVGHQTETRGAHACHGWAGLPSPYNETYTVDAYSELANASNYCRNPGGEAYTIWCFTDPSGSAADVPRWEFCYPIGHNPLLGECPDGYAESSANVRTLLKVIGSVLLALSLVYALVICCFRRAISEAITLCQVASKFVAGNPHAILICIMEPLIALLWCLSWIGLAALLVSQVSANIVPTTPFQTYAEAAGTDTAAGKCNAFWPSGFAWKSRGDVTSPDDPCSGNLGNAPDSPLCWRCGPPRFAFDTRFAFSLFCFLWVLGVIEAVGEILVAGTVAWWAFARDDDKSFSPMMKAVKTTFRYHMGSVMFGAFVVAVVQFLEAIVWYLTEQARAQKNKVMEYIGRCLQCCLGCIEKSIKALNRHAYIQIALNGTTFCRSAINGMTLIMTNLARFTASNILSWCVETTGKAFVIVFTAILGYLIIYEGLHPNEGLTLVPFIAAAVFGHVVGEMFMELFSMAVDTLLHCYCEAAKSKDTLSAASNCNLPLGTLATTGKAKSGRATSSE